MTETKISSSSAVRGILAASLAASGFLIWLIYVKEPAADGSIDVSFLPALNALLNSMSALCLAMGYRSIRRRQVPTHRRYMLGACLFSALFLVSYLIYHYYHGDTPFLGTGIVRPIYFSILISHIVLSVVVLPLALITVYLGLTGRFDQHPRIAKIALPLWFYVSVTGVLVFFLLRYFG